MQVLTQLVLVSLCVCAHSTPQPLSALHRQRSDYGSYAGDYAQDYEPIVYAAIPLHSPMPVIRVLSHRPLSREKERQPSVQHPVYARPPQDNEYASAHNEYDYAGYGSYSSQNVYHGNSGYSTQNGYSGHSGPGSYSGHSGPSGYSGHSGPSGYSGQNAYSEQHQSYDSYAHPSAYPQQYAAEGSSPYVRPLPQQYIAPPTAASQEEVTILYARPNPHGGFSYRKRPAKTALKRSPVSTTESPVIIRVHKYRVVRDP